MPLLTISENLGSGGMSIARQVAEKLNLNLYDDDRLQKEAVDMGIRAEDIMIMNATDFLNLTFTWI